MYRFFCLFLLVVLLSPNNVYSQEANDSSVVIYGWSLDNRLLTPHKSRVDTDLVDIQRNNQVLKKYSSISYLGANGSAYTPNLFFEREPYEGIIYLKSYQDYFYTFNNTQYLNSRKPFTHLFYINGGQKNSKEEGIRILHSQNVNKNFNVGIDLRILSNKGQYKYLSLKNKNFKAFSSYTGERYNMHATYNFNRYTAEENGGVNDSAYLSKEMAPKEVQTNFKGEATSPYKAYVSNKIRYFDGMVSQRFNLLRLGNENDTIKNNKTIVSPIITHVFHIQRSSKMYQEEDIPKVNPDFPIYRNYYSNTGETYDSIGSFKVSNKLQLDFKTKIRDNVSVGVYGSLSHEYFKYSYYTKYDTNIALKSAEEKAVLATNTFFTFYKNNNGDTLSVINRNVSNRNIYVDAGLYGKFWSNFESDFSARIYLLGYKAGQTELEGIMKTKAYIFKKPYQLAVTGNIDNIVPSYQLNYYYSNNYIWEQSLKNVNKVSLSTKLDAPENNFSLSGKYALINNHVYMSDSLPLNYSKVLNIFALEAEKEFVFWEFHSKFRAVYQVSDNNEIVEVPSFIFFNSTYFDHTWKFDMTGGQLRTMVGVDVYYNSSFNGYNYNPALSIFYQDENKIEIGNYPYVDLWLNVNLKRTRFFIKYVHFNSTGTRKDYYNAVSYPAYQRFLKLGLSWTFYN